MFKRSLRAIQGRIAALTSRFGFSFFLAFSSLRRQVKDASVKPMLDIPISMLQIGTFKNIAMVRAMDHVGVTVYLLSLVS